MLSVAQLVGWDGECIFFDALGRSIIVRYLDTGDFGLAPGIHDDILRSADHGIHCDTAERHNGRQSGDFKFHRFHCFRPGFIHSADGD